MLGGDRMIRAPRRPSFVRTDDFGRAFRRHTAKFEPTNTMTDFLLRIDRPQPGCAVLILDRPDALNALSQALRQELVRALDALAREPGLSAVILTGAGRAFCAGLDLKELGASGVPALGGPHDPVAALRTSPYR